MERIEHMNASAAIARIVFWMSVAAMCLLTFVWPFAVSADASHPVYRVAATFTLLAFFASMLVLLARRARLPQSGRRE